MSESDYHKKLSECSISDPKGQDRPKLYDQYCTDEFVKVWDSAPQSSGTKIVLPWDQDVKEYSTVDFHPSYVGNRVSYSDLNPVIHSLKEVPLYDMEGYVSSQRAFHNLLSIIPILTLALIVF